MADKEIELPVVIEKKMLSGITRLRGGVNSDSVTIGPTSYAKDTLVFLGFRGRIDLRDKLYHGVFVFRKAQPKDTDNDALKVADLPQANKPAPKARATTKKTGSEVKHGIH